MVDDGDAVYARLRKLLKQNGFEASAVKSGDEVIDWLRIKEIDLAIFDVDLPGQSGIELLQKVKTISPATEVILLAATADTRVAIDAVKKGAFDYLARPLYPDQVLSVIRAAVDNKEKQAARELRRRTRPTEPAKDRIVGPSYQSQMVEKHIHLIAPTDMSVIISGETGTGKEYVARAIHNQSTRSDKKFVAVDCGAIPRELAGSELFGHVKGAFTGAIADKQGCFERANGGTLFLDEIGNLSYEHQVQLLRVLQEKKVRRIGGTGEVPVDIRLLVATNEDLRQAVSEGDFREDIFYRLNEFKIELVPLHERPEDVPVFAHHFLDEANHQLGKDVAGFEPKVLETFASCRWYGNLRELRNVIKRAVLVCDGATIGAGDLPADLSSFASQQGVPEQAHVNNNTQLSLKEVAGRAERGAIMEVLRKTGHNKSKAATMLGVDRKTLYNKIRAYGIDG